MKHKIIFGGLIILLLINFIVLTIVLTSNNLPNLKDYSLLIGITFITISGFTKKSYKIIFNK